MNKQKYPNLMIVLAGLAAGSTLANTGFYVSGKVGISMMQISGANLDDRAFPVSEKDGSEYTDFGRKNKASMNVGMQVGYDFSSDFGVPTRVEIDYTYRPSTNMSVHGTTYGNPGHVFIENGTIQNKVQTHAIMVNAFYDIETGSAFTPYIGGGVGATIIKNELQYSSAKESEDALSKTKTQFTWALATGVNYKYDDNLTFDLGYRYMDMGKFKLENSDGDSVGSNKYEAKLKSHDVTLGLRYNF